MGDVEHHVDSSIRQPWWKGTRGEWLVIAQVALMALVFFGPRSMPGVTASFPLPYACRIVGAVLMVGGLVLMFAGIFRLGTALTPLPYPKEGGELVQTGPYAIVRHPMYSGGLALAFGFALFMRGWLTLAFVIVLFVLLDFKSRREEKWLSERFPEYADYQRRVHKLIPFLY